MWVPKGQKPSNASTKPPQHAKATKQWIPKRRTSTTTTKSKAKAPTPSPQPNPCPNLRATTQSRWIPKSTLQAQGYYNGQQQIWLPKKLNPLPKTTVSPTPTSRTQTSMVATTSSLPKPAKQVWLPKKQPPMSPTIKHRAQLLQQVFLHQLPQAAAVRIITALQLKTHECA